MPRKIFEPDPYAPYFITGRCINRDWFALEMEDVWSIFEDHLYMLHHGFDVRIHSFLLMSNHFHMIASAPNSNLSIGMAYFMREISRWLTLESGRINQCWGQRFHRSRIGTERQFLNVYKYVYQNPLRAGICQRVEDYRFSTLSVLLGRRQSSITLQPDDWLFSGNIEDNLEWLNQQPESDDLESIRRALRRREFKLPNTRGPKLNSLEYRAF